MSRKDYQAIAESIRAAYVPMVSGELGTPTEELQSAYNAVGARAIIRAVASALAADNPRFNHAQFYAACGMPSGIRVP